MTAKKVTLTESELINLIKKIISEQSIKKPMVKPETVTSQGRETIFDKTKAQHLDRMDLVKKMIKDGYKNYVKRGKIYVYGYNDPIMTSDLNWNDFIAQLQKKYNISWNDVRLAISELKNEPKQFEEPVNTKPQETTSKPKWNKNDQFPLKPYDVGNSIARIQKGLGLPPSQQKGYFGAITLNALKNIGFNIDPNVGIDAKMYAQILDKLGIPRGSQAPPRETQDLSQIPTKRVTRI